MRTRLTRSVILAMVAILTLGVATATATHTHVRALGNGHCVILAPDGGEHDVQLPEAVFDGNPNVTLDYATTASNRRHPLHVLVHLGTAGMESVWVLGSAGDLANCDGYANG